MAFGLIIILFLIGITFRNHNSKKGNSRSKSWSNKQRLIFISILTILPFILINSFVPDEIQYSNEEIVQRHEKVNEQKYYVALEKICSSNMDSLDLQILHLDYFDHEYNSGCKYIVDFTLCKKPENAKILEEYIKMKCGEGIESSNHRYTGLDTLKGEFRGKDYVKGLGNYLSGNTKLGIFYLKQEIKKNPNFSYAYHLLAQIYLQTKSSHYYSFINNTHAKKYLPSEQWLSYYYKSGHFLDYMIGIYTLRFNSINLLPFLAGLCISIVWMYFLRALDFFKKESWKNILIVFSLGTILAHSCLFLYRIAEQTFDFGITGSFMNDFFYCVVVIGGSEELVKFLPWLFFLLFIKKFEEPFDYILYASVSALGFAFAENWMYLESSYSIVIRSIMAVVAHMFDASLVAFGFILARFFFKTKWKKALSIFLGFFAAMLSHGFYDFWLISPSTGDLVVVTFLFFMLTLHFWFYMKNIAINHSAYFSPDHDFNRDKMQDIITFSIISLLIVEFIFVSIDYGSMYGNYILGFQSILIIGFIFYMSMMIFKLDFRKGVWVSYSMQIPFFGKASKRESVGLQLHLRSINKNTFIGSQFPVTGTCLRKITVNNNPNWYVFELDKPIYNNNTLVNLAVLKNRFGHQHLSDDNIEIIFLFIPSHATLEKQNLTIQDFVYVERIFSEPLL